MTRAPTSYAVRPYRDDDEPAVLRLIDEALVVGPAGGRPSRFFRWKHVDNPFGRALMLVAEDGGRIVGLRAFMRWRFRAGDRELSAVRAVDTATDEAYRGQGVFSRLTRDALEALRGEVDFVFNTPNRQSGPGYLKLGWRMVGKVPVALRVRRPVRFLARARSAAARVPLAAPAGPTPAVAAPSAGEALSDGDPLGGLLAATSPADDRLLTPRDVRYLRWRYGDAPLLDYRAVRVRDGDRLRGLAIFRVRSRGRLWEASIAELFAPDVRVARALLRSVRRAAPGADHLVCHFPSGSVPGRAARRSGFLPAPGGPVFVVRPLREAIEPDPTTLASWALTLGDVEVF